MDHLWTPWRSTYITSKNDKPGCVFCLAAASTDDEQNLILHRAKHNFVILNRYPYTNGHLMIAPYRHASRLNEIATDVSAEMMDLARTSERALQHVYQPNGLNLGLNLGEAAGAGIEQHLHFHVLPRWKGDANFMTSIGNARIIPELLNETYTKLSAGFKTALTNIDV